MKTKTILDFLIGQGLYLFPIRAYTKAPATKNGFKDASNDPKQQEEWFKNQHFNVGLPTGLINKLAVVDVDPRNGGNESLKTLVETHNLDTDTLTVRTGSDGLHLYYRIDKPFKGFETLPGIDLQGDGRYVVAPPSFHPSGIRYLFAEDVNLDFSQIKPFPFELFESLKASKKQGIINEKVAEGGRHNFIVARVGELKGRGFGMDEILTTVHQDNRVYCTPPLDKSEIDNIVESMKDKNVVDTYLYAPHTDLGNAERFAAMYKPNSLFVTRKGQWMHYDGTRYVEDHSKRTVSMAKSLLRTLPDFAHILKDNVSKTSYEKHLKKSEGRDKVNAMIELAKSEMPMNLESFDANPLLFNVGNGTVDLKTAELHPHNNKDLLTKLSSIHFDKNAECPLFETFINDITCGDKDLAKYIQKVIGYSLTGVTTEQQFWIYYGAGANGKTTLIEVMKCLYGEYLRSADIATFTMSKSDKIRNDLARLHDARVVSSVEINEGKLLDESVIKQVTGGDPVIARFLFKEHFEYTPAWKLFLAVNHLPHINGNDFGMWRRIKVVPFNAKFDGVNKDKALLGKLKKEMPGILNWAIRGCQLWMSEGLDEPQAVIEASKQYRDDEDVLHNFLSTSTVIGADFSERLSDLYDSFAQQQKSQGQFVISSKLFSQKLKMKGFNKKRGNNGAVVFTGLKLHVKLYAWEVTEGSEAKPDTSS